jgi:hypothetical protein
VASALNRNAILNEQWMPDDILNEQGQAPGAGHRLLIGGGGRLHGHGLEAPLLAADLHRGANAGRFHRRGEEAQRRTAGNQYRNQNRQEPVHRSRRGKEKRKAFSSPLCNRLRLSVETGGRGGAARRVGEEGWF